MSLKFRRPPHHLARPLILFLLFAILFSYSAFAASGTKPKTQNQQPTAKADNEIRSIEFGNLIEREIQTAQTHTYLTKGRADGVLRVRLDADARNAAFDMFIVDAKGDRAVIVDRVDNKEQGIIIAAVTESADNYKIVVRYNKKDTPKANYKLQIEDLRGATAKELSQNRAGKLFAQAERERRALSDKTNAQERAAIIEKYKEAAQIQRDLEDYFGVALSLNSAAFVYQDERLRQREPEAIKQAFEKETETFKQANEAIRKTEQKEVEIIIVNNLGNSYLTIKDWKTAQTYFKEALTLARKNKIRNREEITLGRIQTAYSAASDFDTGVDFFNQQVNAYKAAGNRRGEGIALFQLAEIFRAAIRYQEAIAAYKQALAPLHETEASDFEAAALNNMGLIYRVWGEYQKALDAYSRVLEIDEKIGTPRRQQVQTINNLGLVYFYLGDAKTALEYHNKALDYATAEKDQRNRAFSLNNAGLALDRLGDQQKALAYLQEALQIRESLNQVAQQCATLSVIGEVYRKLNDTPKSIELQKKSIEVCSQSDHRVEGLAYTGLGKAYYESKDYENATTAMTRALEISREFNDRNAQVEELFYLSLIAYDKGDLNKALLQVQEAVKLIESLRASVQNPELRAAFLAAMQDTYDFYIELLMQLHKKNPKGQFDAKALNIKESARARSLLEMLNESRSDLRQGVRADLLEKERTLQQQLNEKASALLGGRSAKENAQFRADIDKINTEYERVQAQIRAESPRYAALTQPQPLSLAEIQQQVLDKDSLLLEYALGPIESYLWVVSADSITSYVLPKRKEINEQARQVYKLLTARNEYKRMETDEQRRARIQQADAAYPQAAAKLSEMILSPAASLLAHKRLIIVADGALQYIPFAALSNPLKTKKYEPLVARNEIVNLPSASTIAILRRETQGRKESAKTLAVIADPVFSDSDERVKNISIKPASGQATRALTGEDTRLLLRLDDDDTPAAEKVMRRINRLPFTRQEANDITNLVSKEETLELLDFDANRDRATNPEMGNYRYVHFASHGYINTEQPQLSAIILSLVDKDGKPQPQGGFLRTIDLYNLNLPVDMVVLSACETGLGKEVKGEGLVGFTRGFMYAGAPRVVVSLWSVSDKATAKLMERFYKRMLKKEMTPAAALRAAQKRMLDEKKWAAPYYWAAFVLQGEWR